MLPEADRPNASLPELARDFSVTAAVPLDFGLPECGVVGREVPAAGTSVPETTVGKDCEPGGGEEKIRLTWKICAMRCPSGDAGPDEGHSEADFGCFVALAADSGHVAGTLGGDIEEAVFQPRFQQAFHKVSQALLLHKVRPLPKFVSLFAGARGLDLGLEHAGLHCIAANEFDSAACNTIRMNAPHLKLYGEDVRLVTAERLSTDLGIKPGELFAVVGGPPCQAFSTAGRRLGLNDERGNVFLHFLDLIDKLQPKYAVFENVRGLLSAPMSHRPHLARGADFPDLEDDEKPGGALKLILALLRKSGYEVTFNLYNTANFGVPQSRERLIFIASREGKRIPHLQPTHSASGADGLLPWATFRDAVIPLKGMKHHFACFPAKRMAYYRLLKQGQNWRDLPADIQEDAMGNSFHSGGGRTGFYRRLAWDKPSPTLVTRPNMKATDLCHPKEPRPLSIEEYAAIQTFPREYKFAGKLDDQYRQIGNAVPCLFAQQIGNHLLRFDANKMVETTKAQRLSRYVNTDESSWIGSVGTAQASLFESRDRGRSLR